MASRNVQPNLVQSLAVWPGRFPPPLHAASDTAAVAANAVSAKRRFLDTDILGFSPYLSIEAAERDFNIC